MAMSSAQPLHFMLVGRLPSDLTDSAPWLASAWMWAPAAFIVSLADDAVEVEAEEDVVDDVVVVTLLVVLLLSSELLAEALIGTDEGRREVTENEAE